MRSKPALTYGVLFFLSGATGLIYELLWVRVLYQSFGSTIQSVTTVVAAPPPTQSLEEQESLQQLRDALMQLRPEEKEVFLLRQNGELTYEQIAELHSRPVGTVKTQMRSALQKLRKVLNPEMQP